uniref:RNA-directed RNA polymerase L n=1 Tax=Blattodean phenui-related virus OKIAV266 TaxID=2746241 RepID=A0A7D7F8D7_9VIRU|nr:RNA-dependent RNA polymerase [Blattodean phenui-related virus OKIAV266]
MDSLQRLAEGVNWAPGVLSCSEPGHYETCRQLGGLVDELTVTPTQDSTKISWHIVPRNDTTTISSITGPMTVEVESTKIGQVGHDFVAARYSGNFDTDVRLGDALGLLNNLDDRLSPDVMLTLPDGRIWFVEVATHRGADGIHDLEEIHRVKVRKYSEAIQSRLGNRSAALLVLVVTRNHIYSTFKLWEEELLEIWVRFRIGYRVEREAERLRLISDRDQTERDRECTLLKKSLSDLKLSNIKASAGSLTAEVDEFNDVWYDSVKTKKVNYNFISKGVADCMDEAMASRKPRSECLADWRQGKDKMMTEMIERSGTTKKKSFIQIPYAVAPKLVGNDVMTSATYTNSCSTPTEHLWADALNCRLSTEGWWEEDVEVLLAEALSPTGEEWMPLAEKKRYHKSTWHRVKTPDVPDWAKRELAKKGLNAKKRKGDLDMLEKRQDSQQSFSPLVDTTDIDNFINEEYTQNWGGDGPGEELLPSLRATMKLLRKSNQLAGNSEDGLGTLEGFMLTDRFQALYQLSCVATELAISLKQNVRKDEWILKRVRGYDIHILAHPTKGSSHLFFSLLYPSGTRLYPGDIFRKLYPICDGEFLITDLASTNHDRLKNLILAPYTWLASSIHWAVSYGIRMEDLTWANLASGGPEPRAMAAVSLLISLDDRANTEETVTQTRYMMMQLFKGSDLLSYPDPARCLSKMPSIIRSRLQAYLLINILTNIGVMLESPPRLRTWEEMGSRSDDVSGDCWEGLLNPITGALVTAGRYVIDAFYSAYGKNKDQKAQDNSSFQLIKKILREGINLDPGRFNQFSGREDTPLKEMKVHDASPSFILFGCDLLCARLREELGPQWRQDLSDDIYTKWITDFSWEKIASFKASGDMDPSEKKARLKTTHPSVKCLEAVVKIVKDKDCLNPLFELKEIMDKVMEDWGGVCCYLFKKAQHGGLREIYVLTIHSRVIQKFVEDAMRVLCQYFPEETLCNPESKTILVGQFFTDVLAASTKTGGTYIHRSSSEDKSTWNQGFIVTTFMLFTARILPDEVARPMCCAIKLWLSKVILLPAPVQKMLLQKIHLSDEVYQQLLRAFWKNLSAEDPPLSEDLFEDQAGSYIHVLAGMWQGILHVTSSVMHLLKCLVYKYVGKTFILPILKTKGATDLIVTTLCSSDDSLTLAAAIMSPTATREDLASVESILDVYMKMEPHLCKFFQMISSAKSVISAKHLFEFNSAYYLRSGLVNPQIKFIYSSLSLNESSTFLKRQEVCYNLVKDLLEAGGTHMQVHLQQLIQGMLHYHLVGMTSNALYEQWAESVLATPSIHCGFFCLDADLIAGIMGSAFAHWLNMRDSRAPVSFSLAKVVKQRDPNVDDFQQNIALYYGDAKRWKNLVQTVVSNLQPEELSQGDRLRILLEKVSHSKKELAVRLESKARDNGAYESLRIKGGVVDMSAQGVYGISTDCFTRGQIRLRPGEEDPEAGPLETHREKMSLLKVAKENESLADSRPETSYRRLPVETILLIFPRYRSYETVYCLLGKYRQPGYIIINTHSYRKKKNTIQFSSHDMGFPCLPLQAFKNIWFGIDVMAARANIEATCRKMKDLFPWIQDTAEDTFRLGPFKEAESLKSFLESFDSKYTAVTPVCRQINSLRPLAQVENCLVFNHYPVTRLIPVSGTEVEEEDTDGGYDAGIVLTDRSMAYQEIMGRIDLILTTPTSNAMKEELINDYLTENADVMSGDYDTTGMTKQEMFIHLALGLLSGNIEIEMLPALLLRIKGGYYIEKIMKQKGKKNEREGRGLWKVYTSVGWVMIHALDNWALAVTVQNMNFLVNQRLLITTIISNLGYSLSSPDIYVDVPRSVRDSIMSIGPARYSDRMLTSTGISIDNRPLLWTECRIYISPCSPEVEQPAASSTRAFLRVDTDTVFLCTDGEEGEKDRLAHVASRACPVAPVVQTTLDCAERKGTLFSYWTHCVPHECLELQRLIMFLHDNYDEPDEDITDDSFKDMGIEKNITYRALKDWLAQTLRYRLVNTKAITRADIVNETLTALVPEYVAEAPSQMPREFYTLMGDAMETFARGMQQEYQPEDLLSMAPVVQQQVEDEVPLWRRRAPSTTESRIASTSWADEVEEEGVVDAAGSESTDTDEEGAVGYTLEEIDRRRQLRWDKEKRVAAQNEEAATRIMEDAIHTVGSGLLDFLGVERTEESDPHFLEDYVPDRQLESLYMRHPFWDLFIRACGDLGIWDKISGKRPHTKLERDWLKDLCWLLGLDLPDMEQPDLFDLARKRRRASSSSSSSPRDSDSC